MSISPNVPSPQESYHYENAGTPRWITALFVVLIAGLAALAYAGYSVRTRFDQELAKADEQNKILTAQLEQANTRIADLKGQVDVTSQKVGMTQAELAQAKSRDHVPCGRGMPSRIRACKMLSPRSPGR